MQPQLPKVDSEERSVEREVVGEAVGESVTVFWVLGLERKEVGGRGK